MGTAERFDFIVIGCGGIGSATLYWLTKTAPNSKILGIEQFELGHHNGGSQDYSRIIRRCYLEKKFAKFARNTYSAWNEAENESGIQLVHKTGGLFMTEENSKETVTDLYVDAMKSVNVDIEVLNATQIMKRWPQFKLKDNVTAVFDSEAGLVDAAMSNAVHQQLAAARGAKTIIKTKVTNISNLPSGKIIVSTSKGEFECKKVIVTAGAWINDVLSTIGVHVPVAVTHEQCYSFPIFIYFDNKREFYGMPIHGIAAFKIGIDAGGPVVNANTRTFVPDSKRENLCMNFLTNTLPKSIGPIALTKTCLYTMTYDRTFLIDTLKCKGYENVIVCCGAGHAFKFAALMGKILSEMAVHGSTEEDISMFSFQRPAITDPTFKPQFAFYETIENSKSKI